MFARFSTFLALLAAKTIAQTPCYTSGISDPAPTTYVKCPNSNMCCRTNDDPSTVDTCAPSGNLMGLCISRNQEYWRESCTDATWKSGQCVKLCMDPYMDTVNNVTINRGNTDYRITRCQSDDSLCCGAPGSQEAGDCCREGRGVFLDNFQVVSTRPSSSAPTSSQSQSRSASATQLNSIMSSATSSIMPLVAPLPVYSNNTGAIAGGVVAGAAGISGIVLVVWLLMKRKKRIAEKEKHDREAAAFLDNKQEREAVGISEKWYSCSGPPAEMESQSRTELSNGSQTVSEMGSNSHIGHGRHGVAPNRDPVELPAGRP